MATHAPCPIDAPHEAICAARPAENAILPGPIPQVNRADPPVNAMRSALATRTRPHGDARGRLGSKHTCFLSDLRATSTTARPGRAPPKCYRRCRRRTFSARGPSRQPTVHPSICSMRAAVSALAKYASSTTGRQLSAQHTAQRPRHEPVPLTLVCDSTHYCVLSGLSWQTRPPGRARRLVIAVGGVGMLVLPQARRSLVGFSRATTSARRRNRGATTGLRGRALTGWWRPRVGGASIVASCLM